MRGFVARLGSTTATRFADRTEDARNAIPTVEPVHATVLSFVPDFFGAEFIGPPSLVGSQCRRAREEGGFCCFLAVLSHPEAV